MLATFIMIGTRYACYTNDIGDQVFENVKYEHFQVNLIGGNEAP